MAREGWLADVIVTPEATLAGSTTGSPVRPPGLRDSSLRQNSAAKFERIDPWGQVRGGQVVQFSHTITIVREFSFDNYANLVLAALSSDAPTTEIADGFTVTTRTNKSTPTAPATYRIFLQTADDRLYLAKGCALDRVEWFIQSGRAIIEETSFQVLRLEEADRLSASTQPAHRITGPQLAEHAMLVGTGTWADPAADKVPSFSTQLIFERAIVQRQYDETGQPNRYETRAGWELVGKSQVRRTIALDDLRTGRACRLWWRIRNPSDPEEWLTVTAPRAWAKANTQPVKVKLDVDDLYDWIATSNNGGAFYTESRRRD